MAVYGVVTWANTSDTNNARSIEHLSIAHNTILRRERVDAESVQYIGKHAGAVGTMQDTRYCDGAPGQNFMRSCPTVTTTRSCRDPETAVGRQRRAVAAASVAAAGAALPPLRRCCCCCV